MTTEHFYEIAKGHGLPHDPFKSIIAPRPIGWISSIDPNGRINLAPYSFFNAFSESPPIIGFSSGGRKDSQRNIEATGEFVFNLATRPLADKMNQTAIPLQHGVNEFDVAGIASAPCRLVKPPRVAASPAALECKLTQVIPLLDAAGRTTYNTLLLGEVVAVHLHTDCLGPDGSFDMTRAHTIARCGRWGDYAEVTSLFQLQRPQRP